MIKCDYCGRENTDETQACGGCGTPLVGGDEATADEEGGDRPVSVGGLLECVLGVVGLLGGHVYSLVHLARGLSRLDNTADADSPHSLLERAAQLESVSMRAAVALYERIVQQHPGTAAAKEAARNLKALLTAHPRLRSGQPAYRQREAH